MVPKDYPRWCFSVPEVLPIFDMEGTPPLCPIPENVVEQLFELEESDLTLGHVWIDEETGEYLLCPETQINFYLLTVKEQDMVVEVSNEEGSDWYLSPYHEVPNRVLVRQLRAVKDNWNLRPYIKQCENAQLDEWLTQNGSYRLTEQLFNLLAELGRASDPERLHNEITRNRHNLRLGRPPRQAGSKNIRNN